MGIILGVDGPAGDEVVSLQELLRVSLYVGKACKGATGPLAVTGRLTDEQAEGLVVGQGGGGDKIFAPCKLCM